MPYGIGLKQTVMNKLFLRVAIAVLPVFGFSQSAFDRFEHMDDVGTVIINKALINLMSKVGEVSDDREAQEFLEAAKGIDDIKVFITEDKQISKDMMSTVKKYLKSSSMEELVRVKDKDVNVKFYIRNDKDEDHVRELLMFVSGLKNLETNVNSRKFETILVSLTGDIDLNKVSSITNKLNLPKELNRAGRR